MVAPTALLVVGGKTISYARLFPVHTVSKYSRGMHRYIRTKKYGSKIWSETSSVGCVFSCRRLKRYERCCLLPRQDLVICNNEKLASGNSGAYVESCRQFLTSTVFKSGSSWPSAILAPSNIKRKDEPNLAIKVRGVRDGQRRRACACGSDAIVRDNTRRRKCLGGAPIIMQRLRRGAGHTERVVVIGSLTVVRCIILCWKSC